MNLRLPLVLAGMLLAASATTAMAQGGYVGASGGVVWVHDGDVSGVGEVGYDVGGNINISGGMRMNLMRAELEWGYKESDLEDLAGDLEVSSFMLNGYYDLAPMAGVTPFLGAGVGFLNGDISGGGDDTTFGYQLMLGAAFKMTPQLNLDIAYRWQSAPTDFEIGGSDVEYTSCSLLAGIRFGF